MEFLRCLFRWKCYRFNTPSIINCQYHSSTKSTCNIYSNFFSSLALFTEVELGILDVLKQVTLSYGGFENRRNVVSIVGGFSLSEDPTRQAYKKQNSVIWPSCSFTHCMLSYLIIKNLICETTHSKITILNQIWPVFNGNTALSWYFVTFSSVFLVKAVYYNGRTGFAE